MYNAMQASKQFLHPTQTHRGGGGIPFTLKSVRANAELDRQLSSQENETDPNPNHRGGRGSTLSLARGGEGGGFDPDTYMLMGAPGPGP